MGMALLTGCGQSVTQDTPSDDLFSTQASEPKDRLSDASDAFESGNFDHASKLLRSLMIERPDHLDTIWLAARVEAERGNLSRSLDLAELIATSDSHSREQAIDLCVQTASNLEDHRRYEKALRRKIAVNPTQPEGYHRLWQHFMRHGRTFEAAQVADLLVDRGQANSQQLESLIFRGQSTPRISIRSGDEQIEQHFEPGQGRARHFFSNNDFQSAREELEDSLAEDSPNRPVNVASAKALLGRVLAESQDDEAFLKWYSSRSSSLETYDDYWFAIGSYHFDHGQYESAVHCLLEALRRNTADLVTYQRIRQSLKALQREDQSEAFAAKASIINESREVAKQWKLDPDDKERISLISKHLLDVGRPLESLRWTELNLPTNAHSQLAQIQMQRQRLRSVPDLRRMMAEDAMTNLSPSQFKLRSLVESQSAGLNQRVWSATPNKDLNVSIRNVAEDVGLNFQWYQGEHADLSSIALYESLGGGVGVIDYDADGRPDLYFAQGSGDPPDLRCTRSNRLFRNLGQRFVSVEKQTNSDEDRYSQSVSVGDINQDGWPDLLIGNIGMNQMLINCGDGTFKDSTDLIHGQGNRFTASMAIADISGDAMPDLFEVNYIQLEGAFDPPEFDSQGRELLHGPLSERPEPDHWYRGDGQCGFDGVPIPESVANPGTGLGIVITDMDDQVGNEVFVGNDARPNHLFTTNSDRWKNTANIRGVASGRFGLSTACMGIATGDFNRDGRFDMHVSNFFNEYDNLFLQTDGGSFRDAAPSYQLPALCLNNVGFGSKSMDVDRDGWLDAMTTNGHIFDQSYLGEPFRQKPLLIHNCLDRFERASVSDSSSYFSTDHLGRGLAKLDWNQDGQMDVVVTHLDHPAALLEIISEATGHGLQLELVGVQSERDAIGTCITIKTARGTQVEWVTAGDGYLCTDEAVIDFGLADCEVIDEMQIQWPGGTNQTFHDVPADQRYLVVENISRLHQR